MISQQTQNLCITLVQLEVVDCGSETKFQVITKLNLIFSALRTKMVKAITQLK